MHEIHNHKEFWCSIVSTCIRILKCMLINIQNKNVTYVQYDCDVYEYLIIAVIS